MKEGGQWAEANRGERAGRSLMRGRRNVLVVDLDELRNCILSKWTQSLEPAQGLDSARIDDAQLDVEEE